MNIYPWNGIAKKIYLKGSQTRGLMKVEDHDIEDNTLERRKEKGKSYAAEYIKKEKEKIDSVCITENSVAHPPGVGDLELVSEGSFIDPNDVGREKLSQVYEEYYNTTPNSRDELMIDHYKSKILSMINLNEITIISGPTGCGKTTQVPQFILDSCAEKKVYCNIIVTQPRRIAAITIAKRVCEERNWPLGTVCGYKIGLKNCTSEGTRLTYVTVGVFLQILMNAKNMNKFTHVILDEVHERDLSMDFAILVVKKFLKSVSRNVKVILMSATADVDKFASYFEKSIVGKFQPAPVICISRTTNYIVQIHYLEELASLGELPEIKYDEPTISDLAFMTCIKLIKQFERLDTELTDKRSVLVFLPGIIEIETLFNKLKDPKIYSPGTVQYKWFPVPLHSSITAEEQALAFRPPPSGLRKIILATNIAESSITVPDVMFVIDFCLTRVLMTDTASNFTSLQLSWASKANCIQRAGRAGRVMEGRVYRMVYRNFYQKLPAQCTPDMLRCPLEKVILQSKLLELGSPKAILALALDPPDLANIEGSILLLKELGGLLLTCRGAPSHEDGDITYLGRLMALMPVDIRITRLIVFGHLFTCLEECVIMGAAMSLKSMFSSPFQKRLKSYNSKLDWADGSCSDCIAFLNVYDVWKLNHTNGYFKRSAGGGEVGWARRHFIQLRTLKEVEVLVEDLTKRLKTFNIERRAGVERVQWNDVQKSFVLKFVIAGAFYPNYFRRSEKGGQVCEETAVRTLRGRDPFTTVYFQNYPQDQPAELYSHLIKDQMAECKEDMKISYDSTSKVFVEFRKQDLKTDNADMPFNSEVPGKISMAVYRAVKIRQTMKGIDIKILPSDQAKSLAEKLGVESRESPFLQCVQEKPAKEKLFRSLLPGIGVNFLPINITHSADPGHFWAVSNDAITDRREKELFEMLNHPDVEFEKYEEVPRIGEMCVAPYKEDGEVWLYRGRVDALKKEGGQNFAQIFFIDYGNSEVVPVSSLRKYSPGQLEKFGNIPAQAFECVLTRVKPSAIKDPNGKWAPEAKKEFHKLIHEGNLIGSIYSVVSGVVSLVLYKVCPGVYGRQININQHLIKAGFAEEVEESYLSKENNDLRVERQLDSDQKDAYNSLQLQDSFMWESPFQPPDLQNCNLSVKLKGPFSPLEMKVFSCARGGMSKQVIISQSSVNSVLLDSDPQDPHERLLVAGHISQNQEGNSLILGQTTIMPNIHGLSALIALVFAPKVEVRVDDKRTKYTGVLCGLGVDEEGRALFPEHDMEFVFDCEFTQEDLCTINKLRLFMSLLLRSEEDNRQALTSHPDVVGFQNKIKASLMKLIDKHRPSVEPVYSRKGYKWKLVKEDPPQKNPAARDYYHELVFPLHSLISITANRLKKIDLLKHVNLLTELTKDKVELSSPVECELCDMTFQDVKPLRLHLATEDHKKEVEKLRKAIGEQAEELPPSLPS